MTSLCREAVRVATYWIASYQSRLWEIILSPIIVDKPNIKMAIGSGNETIANGHSAFGTLNDELDYDVLIIGAGLSGIYSMHRVRELGMKAKVLEAGSSVGGTWFWCVTTSTRVS